MMDGFLNIYKPAGISSFDAVKIVLKEILGGKKSEKRVKIGHAGTLDPMAEGVLVLAVNRATKLISYVQQQNKTYHATFLLGVESDSEDTETELRHLPHPPIPTQAEIEAIFPEFLGEILQRPPQYSAIKIQGKRAYKLARQGKQAELPLRKITIHHLEILRYEYPTLALSIQCSSGTYVRSLGRDMGQKLGTGAVMSALTRTAVGIFRQEDALEIQPNSSLRALSRKPCLEYLRPLLDAFPDARKIVYDTENQRRLICGIPVFWPESTDWLPQERVVVLRPTGEFLAVVHATSEGLRSDVHLGGAK
ncbi:MAG: tRNA pseudouridine(55) synthase TruB [Planctomycetia bacterium]|nr:tRNA pseudouridine(55) synthase TruB [Planctomycetia bacterium]